MHGLTLILLIAALGAYHGANPAMGWLFAVSLGMQDGSRRSVVRALPAIAIGLVADPAALQMAAAAALLGFGLFRFARPRWHPRWTRMRVRGRELVLWSFLMSSAHGAGLMVLPLLIAGADAGNHGLLPAGHMQVVPTVVLVSVHAAAMIAVTSAVALLVYSRFSTSLLRRIWLNTDGVWATAFLVSGTFALLTA
jgi:hypothetical protein